ncbi:F-box/FBD/LRR-repeat protein At1g13570-like isoform X2 [Rutidosis leptorrhynchoides]
MDIISRLPTDIIEAILCFLPIDEAVRTSILAREWRYRWTKIPKLQFMSGPWDFDRSLSKTVRKIERCKFLYAISQVLLIHEGPIHEFTISLLTSGISDEIHNIIHHLSSKFSVKKLTLNLTLYTPPSSLFSLRQLTYLYLSGCELDDQPSFIEFGSLTSLFLVDVSIRENGLVHLLSHCPRLKVLELNYELDYESIENGGELTIIDLFECLPSIENLSISFDHLECFVDNGFPRVLPSVLVHLKYLWIKDIFHIHEKRSPIIALLLRSSPNLEKLWLNFLEDEDPKERSDAIKLADYSDIWLEHLNEFQIIYR